MNDTMNTNAREAGEFRAFVLSIAKHLPGRWALAAPDSDHWDRYSVTLHNGEAGPSLHFDNRESGRVTIRPTNWPTYRDESGKVTTCWPSNGIRAVRSQPVPETTASKDRKPDVIARQIVRRVLEPAGPMWAALAEQARSNEKYAARKVAAYDELCASIGSEPRRNNGGFYLYARNIPGHVHLKYNGPDSVDIGGISADEAIELLNRLRELRG